MATPERFSCNEIDTLLAGSDSILTHRSSERQNVREKRRTTKKHTQSAEQTLKELLGLREE